MNLESKPVGNNDRFRFSSHPGQSDFHAQVGTGTATTPVTYRQSSISSGRDKAQLLP
jgi:hypothetical protein